MSRACPDSGERGDAAAAAATAEATRAAEGGALVLMEGPDASTLGDPGSVTLGRRCNRDRRAAAGRGATNQTEAMGAVWTEGEGRRA